MQRSGSPSRGDEAVKAARVSLFVDHPRLLSTDAESIRTFLRRYDQYCNTVVVRAKQLPSSASSTGSSTVEAVRPVDLKFCVDVEFLTSSIALGFVAGFDSFDDVTDKQVRDFLDSRATESKEAVTLSGLDDIVQRELRTDMRNKNATARMQDLFASYHTILLRHGLKWIITEDHKVAVGHVLQAIRPATLRDRLLSDLAFSHHELRKDFPGFLKHAIRLADAFQLVESGPKADRKTGQGTSSQHNKGLKLGEDEARGTVVPLAPSPVEGNSSSPQGLPGLPAGRKQRLYNERAAERAKNGLASGTRSKKDHEKGHEQKPLIGRLAQPVNLHSTPSCQIVVSDGLASLTARRRCDDGRDDSIVSTKLAQAAVVKRIGRMSDIAPVHLRVALQESEDAPKFAFSRKWTVPRLVLELSSGRMALLNVSFLVADDELACEDLLVGLPVLQHLGIDTRTLLERNWDMLSGTDCAAIKPTADVRNCGALGRIIVEKKAKEDADEEERHLVDTTRLRTDYQAQRAETDPFPDPSLIDVKGPSDDTYVNSEINGILRRAQDEGFPKKYKQELEALVWKHAGCFDVSFSSTPSKIEPLRLVLREDAKPVRVKHRNYSEEQRDFTLVSQLVERGCVYPNPSSAWACAPLLVPKAGPPGWRITVDLRPVNHYTVRHQFPMPILDHELPKLAPSTCYSNFDFTHSYWQLLLHPDSQETQSFITPDGVCTPTRVPHGTTNAVTHLQSGLTQTFPEEVKEQSLLWLDDCLLHNTSAADQLDTLRHFFEYCNNYNWKLHPSKCVLYSKTVRWCVRIISSDGIRHDPRRVDGLVEMDCPTTGGELQQFVCAMQWLRSSIPHFQRLIEPLHTILEEVYKKAGKRTKRAVARVSLSDVGWATSHASAFDACKPAIVHRVTLAHRDKCKRLCIYKDASDSHWSGILTQIPEAQLREDHSDQAHEPLAFPSGRFSSVQLGWSTLEKGAFAVMATLQRSHWLAAYPDGFDLYTDHKNLIFIFDPLSLMPDIGLAAVGKVLRRAVGISTYNYVCVHIPGEDNTWADLLSRWTIPLTFRRLVNIPPLPTTFTDFEWPSKETVCQSQEKSAPSRPDHLVEIAGVWRYPSTNAAWIPADDTDLQLRLAVVAHTGAAGHRGRKATELALAQEFSWSTISADIGVFVASCIHCISTTGGETVPRPFGPSVHGTCPNDLVQFDYIDLGLASSGDKYVLLVRDDHSGYAWFYPSASASAETAAGALVDWCAAFGTPPMLMSDGPTHFKNEALRLLAKGLRVPHHFTLPYCPWSNGGIERLGKELLRVARAVLSELQLAHDNWPQTIPMLQSAINNAPSPQRNNMPPITAFTGRPSSPPISTIIGNADTVPVTLTEAQKERSLHMDATVDAMDNLHPVVQASLAEQRDSMRECRNKGDLANFHEGDFVLVARDVFHQGEKLCLRWRGPRRVRKALNEYSFQVEDLRNNTLSVVHGTHLKFYHDPSLDTTAIMSHVLSSETGMPVARLLRLVENQGRILVAVRWKGLSHDEDSLEPLTRVHEDVPQLLYKLLHRKTTAAHLRAKGMSELGL